MEKASIESTEQILQNQRQKEFKKEFPFVNGL